MPWNTPRPPTWSGDDAYPCSLGTRYPSRHLHVCRHIELLKNVDFDPATRFKIPIPALNNETNIRSVAEHGGGHQQERHGEDGRTSAVLLPKLVAV